MDGGTVESVAPPVLRPEHPTPRPLAALVDEFTLPLRGDADGVEVTGITNASRDVRPGDLFAALPGVARHGAEFALDAIERGAVAVVTDPAGADRIDADVPIVVLDDPRAALGEIAAWVYRTREQPPTLYGITGTNGKTSTAFILEGLLADLGFVTGLSTTAERHVGGEVVTSKLTTPEASELHALLARMREAGVRAAVLEVSAQAIERHRIDGVEFDVVAFTNLSHDHLDDYASMEEYFAVKLELFSPDRAERGVVCVDSAWGRRVAEETRIPVTTVSASDDDAVECDWRVRILDERVDGTRFELAGRERAIEVQIPFIGRHFAVDAAIAILMLVEQGFELDAIAETLERGMRPLLPGRMERVSGARGPAAFVDYGHSPDAFEQTLQALRRVTEGRLVFVFGADGDRDATKRHEMGRIAATGADVVIVTDFNPRTEDAASIRAQVLEGARSVAGAAVHEVSPEEDAIRLAVSLAGPGDTILWAGPGDADYRDVAGVREAFVARDETVLALHEAGWTE